MRETHANESYQTFQRVMSHMSTSHVTHVKLRDTCQRVMSNISTSHVTVVLIRSCHTYQRVMSHMSTSVAQKNAAKHTATLQHTAHVNTATHCTCQRVMAYTSTSNITIVLIGLCHTCPRVIRQYVAVHCKKHAATHCNTPQHTAHLIDFYHTCPRVKLRCVVVCCTTHTASHCNTLQMSTGQVSHVTHVTHVNTCERVISHMLRSHVPHRLLSEFECAFRPNAPCALTY